MDKKWRDEGFFITEALATLKIRDKLKIKSSL